MAIAVVDYSKGNLSSVVRGLDRAGARAIATADADDIARASGIVIPGVGAFADAMATMEATGQAQAIREAARAGAPVLGICLGLQLLFERGDEGVEGADGTGSGRTVAGLALLPGHVERLVSSRLKVPHVGWDSLDLAERASACPLLEGVPWGANVYFTHSYALADDVPAELVMAKTHYAASFPSAVWQGNLYGVQFHPEKSSWLGARILENFAQVVGRR